MLNGKHGILAMAAAALLLPGMTRAITMEVTDRDGNNWSLQGEDTTLVNLSDCMTNVEYIITADLESASTTSRYLYLYEGSTCNDTPETCRIIGDSQSPSDLTFAVTTADLFPDGCNASDTAAIWVGLLTTDNETEDDGGYWSAALTITLDVTGPSTAPTGLTARIGSGNVRISWSEVSDASGFRLVYWDGTGASDADTDTDTDTDTDVDAGADAGSGKLDFTPVPYAADAGTGDASEVCTVTGGPAGGVAYSQALVSGYDDSQMNVADATSATIDGLTNGVQYKFAVVSLDDAANPSVFSEAICATPEETVDFSEIYDGAGGKGGGHYCFIATAAFGSYDHPTVRVLRAFRDGFLAKVPGGRAVIAAYYAVGPSLAATVEGDEGVRAAVADGLTVLSGTAIGLMAIGPTRFTAGLAACLVLGLFIGLKLPRRRRNA